MKNTTRRPGLRRAAPGLILAIVAFAVFIPRALAASIVLSNEGSEPFVSPWTSEASCNRNGTLPDCLNGHNVITNEVPSGFAPREGTKVERVEAQGGCTSARSCTQDVSSAADQSNQRTHAELLYNPATGGSRGVTKWYGFSVYFPSGFDALPRDALRAGFFTPSSWHTSGSGSGSPNTAINPQTGEFYFDGGSAASPRIHWTIATHVEGADSGRWIDLAVKMKCNTAGTPDGAFELWRWEVGRDTGPVLVNTYAGFTMTGPTHSGTGNPCWKFRQGIYRRSSLLSSSHTDVVYYDSTRVGDTLDEVAPWNFASTM